MNINPATIHSISAEPEHIYIHGEWNTPSDTPIILYIHEHQPYDLDANHSLPIAQFIYPNLQPSITFRLELPRFEGQRDRLYSRFLVRVGSPGESTGPALPGVCHVTECSSIAISNAPYPSHRTIKGLQVNMVEDALKLGVGHAALNLNLATIIRPMAGSNTITYPMDGREFYFDGKYLEAFDQRVKVLSDHGIVVNLILLNSLKWDDIEIHPDMREALVHPDYNPEGLISAFNVTTAAGLEHYKAFVEFVAERYTRTDQRHGRACGYIIGNEVCSQWVWSNAGEKSVEDFTREYAIALRTAFYAARKKYAQARVYVSLDHHWTISHLENRSRTYPGREVIDVLNRICTEDGNFDWSLAYHPYPQDLTRSDFWNDQTATPEFQSPRITFKNLEVLCAYMAQPHLQFEGHTRRIILSEQGFHSDESQAGERLQAAAYAYAYWKIERLPQIESFILHAHVDHQDEFGLNLGIWRRDKASSSPNAPGTPKPIYDVFRQIDGPSHDKIMEEAKAVVGLDHWS